MCKSRYRDIKVQFSFLEIDFFGRVVGFIKRKMATCILSDVLTEIIRIVLLPPNDVSIAVTNQAFNPSQA